MYHFPILTIRCWSPKPGEDYGETVVRYMEDQILGKPYRIKMWRGSWWSLSKAKAGISSRRLGFYPALRKFCEKYDILLIVDEVQSGMGRTGKWWAIQHFGVEPDIVCVGKGVASGIPLGAIIARKSVVTWPLGSHGNTYGGNPIACAAGLASIELIRDEYMQNRRSGRRYALDALEEIKSATQLLAMCEVWVDDWG